MKPTDTTDTRVALYLRQSKDSEGDELAVGRQGDNCTLLVERRGWEVDPARVYVDNDVSASSAKPRPAYQRLVADVEAGLVDVVVAWNLDRLTRRPREIEDWLDWHAQHGVNLLTSEERDPIDLTTESGRMMLRIKAAVARQEVERKGRRQRESNAQGRSMGVPPGGRRAFGYTRLSLGARGMTATRLGAGGVTYPAYGHEPFEPEAGAVRRGYDMLLAGATLRSIARAWNDAGLTTTVGHAWEPYGVRGVLANPRNAALVAPPRAAVTSGQAAAHNLKLSDLPSGSWEPLVTPETWAAARDLLSDPGRRTNPGGMPRSLLSGIAVCGVCGAPMKAGAVRGIQVYRCAITPHLARKRADADHYVTEVVIERLSRKDAADLLVDHDAPDVDKLRAQMREAQQGEADVASLVARGLMSARAAEGSLLEVRRRIAGLEAKLTDAGKADVLKPLVDSTDVRAAWQALDGDGQRAVVRMLMAPEMRSPGKGSRAPRDGAGRLAHTRDTMALNWHRSYAAADS